MSKSKPLCAEDLPYWKTSQVATDSWLAKASAEITKAGGVVRGQGNLMMDGKQVVFIEFLIESEPYRIGYPALQTRVKGQERAAIIQAATAMYHDVKARCVSLRWLGARTAFGGYRLLPNGQTDGQISTPELAQVLMLLPAPRKSEP